MYKNIERKSEMVLHGEKFRNPFSTGTYRGNFEQVFSESALVKLFVLAIANSSIATQFHDFDTVIPVTAAPPSGVWLEASVADCFAPKPKSSAATAHPHLFGGRF